MRKEHITRQRAVRVLISKVSIVQSTIRQRDVSKHTTVRDQIFSRTMHTQIATNRYDCYKANELLNESAFAYRI